MTVPKLTLFRAACASCREKQWRAPLGIGLRTIALKILI
jgi:hypothetical protein